MAYVLRLLLFIFLFAGLCVLPASASYTVTSLTATSSVIGGSNQPIAVTVQILRSAGDNSSYAIPITGGTGISLDPIFVGTGNSGTTTTYSVSPVSSDTATTLSSGGQVANITLHPFQVSIAVGGSIVGGSINSLDAAVSLNVPTYGGRYIYLSTAGPITLSSGSVFITDGHSTGHVTITAPSVSAETSATLSGSVASEPPGTGTVSVLPFLVTLKLPSVLHSGDNAKGNVSLNAPPNGYVRVYLSDTAGLLAFPAVYVLSGQPSASFQFNALTVSDIKLTTATGTVYGPGGTANVEVLPDPAPPRCKDCEGQAGPPTNLSTGNVWIDQSDYSIPGLGGGLALSRTWNSLWQSSSPVELVGMFGHSWRSTFEERLQTFTGGSTWYWQSNGDRQTYSYDSLNNVYHLEAPLDEHASLTLDPSTGNRVISFMDGSKRVFNSAGYLISLSDRNNNQISIAYDANNRIIQVTDPASRTLNFNYPDGATHLVSSVQDATGTVASYAYDASSRLLNVAYPDGSAINFAYDGSSRITSVMDSAGKVLEAHTYDSSGRGLSSSRANGVDQFTVSYPSPGSTQLTDSVGNVTNYASSSTGGIRVVDSINGPGCSSCGGRGVNDYSHDDSGNRTSSTDALGHVISSTYDSMSNVLSRSTQLGGTTVTSSYTYNSFGEVLTSTDPLGNITANAYDANGNLLSTTTPPPAAGQAASVTSFTYDSKGQLLTVTDPLGHVTTMTYSPAGLVLTITDALNNATHYEYDARGNRTAVVDALTNRTTYVYDSMNRLTRVTTPDLNFTGFTYDTRGRRISITDANNKITSYAYDDADRLTSVTDAANNLTSYAYDNENNLISITDALGRVTSFHYDAMGRVTQTTFPSTLSEYFNYDQIGNLLSKVDRKGNTTTYSYDALNRLAQKQYQDNSTVNFTYDLAGKLTQSSDATGAYLLSYDNMGRLAEADTTYSFLPSRTLAVKSAYDAASDRTSMTNAENTVTTYTYDVLNRFSRATYGGLYNAYVYDADGRPTTIQRPVVGSGMLNTLFSYDNLSRVTTIHENFGSGDYFVYAYDAVGNRATGQRFNYWARNYGYDNLYQLKQVTQTSPAGGNEAYTYDLAGNRTSSLSANYTVNSSNQLTSQGSATYTYDNNGNTLTKTDSTGTTSYTWDFENRLSTATLPGHAAVTFKYDPFGRRIQKGSEIYVYDGANVIEDLNSSGTATLKYVYGLGTDDLLMLDNGVTYYAMKDALGSITTLRRASTRANTVSVYDYDSFGNLQQNSEMFANRYKYTGREFDSETGLYYYRARYYDQSIGRFLSEDPGGFDGGLNLYKYSRNSPLKYVDPSGLCEVIFKLKLWSFDTVTVGSPSAPWDLGVTHQENADGILPMNTLECHWTRKYSTKIDTVTTYLVEEACSGMYDCHYKPRVHLYFKKEETQSQGTTTKTWNSGTFTVTGFDSDFLEELFCRQHSPPE